MHKRIEIHQIANHAGTGIDSARNRDLHGIIVAVTVRIVALAIDGLVLRGRHFLAMQPVGRREQIPSCEVGLHASP